MKDHNFFTVQGWMVNKLKLEGNELMTYAIIFGYCQEDPVNDAYRGSGKYIADSLLISRRTVTTVFESLVKKGYIKKVDIFERNLKFCNYYLNTEFLPKGEEKEGMENFSIGRKNTSGGEKKEGMENFSIGRKNTSGGMENFSKGMENSANHIDLNNYINTTTTAKRPNSSEKAPTEDSTAAVVNLSPDDVKQAILALDRSLLLKVDFYPKAAAFMSLNYLDKSYLAWLYKQVEMREPYNFDGLFFNLFFAENMLEKYKISRQPAKPPPPVEIKCPVCGAVHDGELDKCPLCSLPKGSSSGDIALFKKLRHLPPDKQNEYLQKSDDIYKKFDPFIPSEIEKRKNMMKALDKEFGVGVKNEEPSLRYHP